MTDIHEDGLLTVVYSLLMALPHSSTYGFLSMTKCMQSNPQTNRNVITALGLYCIVFKITRLFVGNELCMKLSVTSWKGDSSVNTVRLMNIGTDR